MSYFNNIISKKVLHVKNINTTIDTERNTYGN